MTGVAMKELANAVRLPPGAALVFHAATWWAAAAYGRWDHEVRARQHLAATIDRAPADLSPVHAAVRDAARACVLAPADLDLRRALGRALDGVIDHGRRQSPAPMTDHDAQTNVWWER
jgi:alkyl sulfatase BDS1-like metallo-beta-lactamase superfamily hydrolase